MKTEYIDSKLLRKMFIFAAKSLEKNKKTVDALNVFPVPDGDTGTNMSLTMQSAVKQIKNLDSDDIAQIASAASKGSLMGARGNSGVILSQLFRGFAKGLNDVKKIDTKAIAKAFKSASDTAYKAVMKPTEGTILTVARECAEKASELSEHETDIKVFLETVIDYGETVLNKTPDMLEVLKQAGVVDAGGKGLIFILKGAYLGLVSEDDSVIEDLDHAEEPANLSDAHEQEDIKFGYCTEFIINTTNGNADEFRNQISGYGDSILVVGGDDIIKVHIHTNEPGEVINKAMALGELIDIKIDNMRYQHKNRILEEETVTENEEENIKEYSFIAVAMGDGIKNVFKDLNIDYVIAGGQTMNPSTEDILNAINEVKGRNVIILPNNSNIILAATQAKELSDKNVEVIPAKTIPQGISAMLAFDEELDINENVDNMTKAISSVKTGQITFAVRDTVINDVEINKDDIIGLNDGDIVTVGNNIKDVAIDLVKELVDEDNYLITIIYGEDISEGEANELAEEIENEAEDCDVEVVYGGQPLYYYIISVE
ncbi:DAK2 domain-containing protein [Caldisalinibacter kiritimatiensis]|uniref:Dihydroxyacetone kinase family protein n=1 Tax=Caldisalinibacter kiritimatiensis TaxID=1304284 RepID=R1AV63_9FIRM|nr:DAK2 domain-containing protein [Caldisalinibacter kiritimatiensis]EOD00522.1 Dihydroxyacetone kinase family protein [Caldisalinibacter kiritimatiensis]